MVAGAVASSPVACPQCGNFWDAGSLFVRDACGHRKCRGCVIVEGNECGTCRLQAEAHGLPAAEASPGAPGGGVSVGPTGSENGGSNGGAATGPAPASETPPGGAQPANRNVKSNMTASSNKKNDMPQQGTGKKVLDELNVTNANNVAELACEDSADAEAVDDPDELPEGDRPAVKRPPPPSHGVIKLPGLPVTYCCTICGHKFKSRSTVRYHYYCGVENKPLTCELCMKGFVSKSHYQYHMRDHAGDLPYKCDVCGKGFKQKTKLKRHSIVHTDDRKFKCSTCGKLFAEASHLKVHSRLHTGERPYKCELCGRSFNERTNYSKHVRSIHTNERPYACEMCGKCFARSENLKVHLRRHKGIRPHECPVCSLTFTYKKDMTRHMPVHDSSVRPFECDKCSQTFKRKDNLLRHIKLSHNEDEKVDEPQSESGEKGAEADAARESRAAAPEGARTLAAGAERTEEDTREEASKWGRPQGSSAAGSVATDPSVAPASAGEAAGPQSKPDADKQPSTDPPDTDGTADTNASRPLRKRRVRVPPDPSACSSLPVFRRNVTPPPGALPEPPRVPRHCLPAPRQRRAVTRHCPPAPVDFLAKRTAGRKRHKKEPETDTTDIEKVGFIQVPQYPPKPPPASKPVPGQSNEAVQSGAAKVAETCGAVPVIKRPQSQPSNCVRTITKTPQPQPQQAVSTIVSPRSRAVAPQPTHTAPPLPPLPACSPRPDQPMLRLLLHDTPCSDAPPPPAPERAETPPAPPTSAAHPAEGLGLCDIYECILRGDLGQLTGGRHSSTDRRLPAPAVPVTTREWRPERTAPLPRERHRVVADRVTVPQDLPAAERSPGTSERLGTAKVCSGTAEVQTATTGKSDPVPRKEVAFAPGHFSVQQSYREQRHAEGQLPLWPADTPLSAGTGKQKRPADGSQPPSADTTYNLNEFDTYCSFVRIRTTKQTVFCGKKSGRSTFVEEEQRHATYAEVRRPGKRMSAISDRLSDDNEEDDDGALNYTKYGGGKKLPEQYSSDGPRPHDGYPGPHYGSRGGETADAFDVIAQLRDCSEDPAVPYGSGRAEAAGGVRNLSPHRDVAARQPHVIVSTGKRSDVPYS